MRSVLEFPWAYNLMQVLSGWHGGGQRRFISKVLRPSPGDRVLDVGCGTGAVLARLRDVDYTGMDMNERYIAHARRTHGKAGRFLCANVYDFDFSTERKFDLILMLGLLHHLNDAGASRLLAQARALLDQKGRLVTLDACRTEGQTRFERWLVDMDRGQYVRPVDGYLEMAGSVFPGVTSYFCTDLLTYPYTHFVMECSLSEAEPVGQDSAVAVPEAG